MKTKIIILFLLTGIYLCRSQDFVNLDFEAADVSAYGSGPAFVPITNAMPGWQQGYNDGSPLGFGFVFYNTVSLGSPAISLQGPGSLSTILQGSYSVIMQPFSSTIAIAQMGIVRSTAQSLRFYASGSFSVSFAGHEIPLSNLGNRPTYTIYGGDISGFANQSGLLQFQGGGTLDNIFFSPQAIPEPGVFGLFAVGALLIGWRLRHKTR